MRILGLDVGDRTIGIAVSDTLGITAQPLTTLKRATLEKDLVFLGKIIEEWEIGQIVVGLPLNMNGSLGPQGKKAVSFKEKLEKATNLPVVCWDERLSSAAAEKILLEGNLSRAKRKKNIDKIAAAIILQSFLESRGS
ncbi:MAG: Holliday junction resolvase RuvX [Clostridia bacterium]|nr:Holliday junction resolvase RuvX [Clostridia bacterium]